MDFLSDIKFLGGSAAKKIETATLAFVVIVFVLLIILITGIRGNMSESLQNVLVIFSLILLGAAGLGNAYGVFLNSSE